MSIRDLLAEENMSNVTDINMQEISGNDIAVVGISIKAPDSENKEDFWKNLLLGVNLIKDLPLDRKVQVEEYIKYFEPQSNYGLLRGGFLDHINQFDYEFFRVSPNDAMLMDPNQRLILQVLYQAAVDAGMTEEILKETRTGVYIGFGSYSGNEYARYLEKVAPDKIASDVTGNLNHMIASRLSYFLDLKGPSIVIDTTCSSSLVALHIACQGIREKDCDMALVGGINLRLFPVVGLSNVILSKDGIAKTFDNRANGTGIGEGVIGIFLKPLNKALIERDNIYAVIKGSAINQDGATNGITAPNPAAQEDVIIRALENSRIIPDMISYIEAHGTGTKLGDPIEIDGITRAFRHYTNKTQFCGIGSIKTNFGHLDSASGLLGFVKAVLSIYYGIIPPSLNINYPNRMIPFEKSPVYVNDVKRDWKKSQVPRYCGVSAFGLGGTNCHVILGEAPPLKRDKGGKQQMNILALSAKSLYSLGAITQRYYDYLIDYPELSLRNLCYTANVHRTHFKYRIIIIFQNRCELIEGLEFLLCNSLTGSLGKKVYSNICMEDISIDKQNSLTVLENYANDYVSGKKVDWSRLYTGEKLIKLSLPTYEFEKKVCWINTPFISRPEEENIYIPVWEPLPLPIPMSTYTNDKILILYPEDNVRAVAMMKLLIEDGMGMFAIPFEENLEIRLMQEKPDKIVCLLPPSGKEPSSKLVDLNSNVNMIGERILDFFKLIINIGNSSIKEIIILTSGLNLVTSEDIIIPEQAIIRGLAKVYSLENPTTPCRVIDMDYETTSLQIAEEIYSDIKTEYPAYRKGIRYVQKITIEDISYKYDFPLTTDGIYIITGGIGGLGIEAAEFLASKGPVNIALISRRNIYEIRDKEEDILNRIDAMNLQGNEVIAYSADVSNLDQMSELIEFLRNKYTKINGIIHCAGVLIEESIKNCTIRNMKKVIEAKVTGTWILDHLTLEDDLEFFVMFSSASSIFCMPGQAYYAAANAFLDEYGEFMRKYNRKAVVINWTAWKQKGMVKNIDLSEDSIFRPLSVEKALSIFSKILYSRIPHAIVCDVRWDIAYKTNLFHRYCSTSLLTRLKKLNKENPRAKSNNLFETIMLKMDFHLKYDTSFSKESKLYPIEFLYRYYLWKLCKQIVYYHKKSNILINEIISELGIIPNYIKLFRAILIMMEKYDLIHTEIDKIYLSDGSLLPSSEMTTILEKNPELKSYWDVLELCLENCLQVMIGKRTGINVLFNQESLSLVKRIYKCEDNDYNLRLAAILIESYIEEYVRLDEDCKICILEIGAGFDGPSLNILNKLSVFSGKIEYCYASILPESVQDTVEQFGKKYSFVTFKHVDLEVDFEEQCLSLNSFHIIIGANVVHTSRQIAPVMQKIRKLLVDQGLLLLIEDTKNNDLNTLVFGLLEEWWKYEDENIRIPYSPLVSKKNWSKIVLNTGFAENYISENKCGQSLILAMNRYTDGNELKSQIKEKELDGFEEINIKLIGRKSQVFSNVEREIAKVYGEILGYKKIDVTQSFYEMGGDSISAGRIVNKLHQEKGYHLTISDILLYQSIEALASFIIMRQGESRELEETDISDKLVIKKKNETPNHYYPTSPEQSRMYFLYQIKELRMAYHISAAVELPKEIEISRLQNALNMIIDRHESFRTSFSLFEDAVMQKIQEKASLSIEYEELSTISLEEVLESFVEPFDLSRPPLLRVKVVKMLKDKRIMLFNMPHIISDGTSLRIFIDELICLYNGMDLPEVIMQPKDYTIFRNQNNLKIERCREYWKTQFKDRIPLLNFPYDFVRPIVNSYNGNILQKSIPLDLVHKIQKLCLDLKCSLYVFMFASYYILLSKYTGQEDIIVGTAFSGRNHISIENTIGMFVHTLAIRNFPRRNLQFLEFLNLVKGSILNAFDNQEYPFEKLVQELGLSGEFNSNPLFSTSFIMQNLLINKLEMNTELFTRLKLPFRYSRYDFSMVIYEEKNEVIIEVEYSTELFKTETIIKFIEHYIEILNAVAMNRTVLVGDIRLSNQFTSDELETNEVDDIDFVF